FQRAPPFPAHLAPTISVPVPALPVSAPHRSTRFRRKAPSAAVTLRAKPAPPESHAASPAAGQFRTSPVASAHAYAHPGASAEFRRRALSQSAHPTLSPLPSAAGPSWSAASANFPVLPQTFRPHPANSSLAPLERSALHRLNSNALPLLTPASRSPRPRHPQRRARSP